MLGRPCFVELAFESLSESMLHGLKLELLLLLLEENPASGRSPRCMDFRLGAACTDGGPNSRASSCLPQSDHLLPVLGVKV